MSLLLRKQCQPVLDKVGLPDHHVAVNQSNLLEIRCECGRPFVSVAGIRFNRQTPSKDELAYAAELFAKYMDSHKAILLAYHAKEEAFKQKPEVVLPENLQAYSTQYGTITSPIRRCEWKVDNYTLSFLYSFVTKDFDSKITLKIDKSFTWDELKKFKVNDKMLKGITTILNEYIEYTEERDALNQEKMNLSICEI